MGDPDGDEVAARTADAPPAAPTGRGDVAVPPVAWWRRAVRSYAELFALSGFAIAQPMLDLFGNAPDAFLARRATGGEIVLFALALAVLPSAVAFGVAQGLGAVHRRTGEVVHSLFLGGFVTVLGLQVVKKSALPKGAAVVAASLVLGGLAVLSYRRFRWVKDWLTFASLAPIAFVGIFLFASQAADVRNEKPVEAVKTEAARKPVSIVMVVWDEWPLTTLPNKDGRIDPLLYPNLAALAKDGGWYRNATTVASATNFAVPAILDGRHAKEGTAIATASQYPENLFTLLASQYDLEVAESVTRLCPTNLCDGPFVDNPTPAPSGAGDPAPTLAVKEAPSGLGAVLADAWVTFRAAIDPGDDVATVVSFDEAVTVQTTTTAAPGTTLVATDDAVRQARDQEAGPGNGIGGAGGLPVLSLDSVTNLLASIETGEKPTLHFLHLQLPHTPYRFLPGGQSYSDIPGGALDPGMMAAVMGSQSTEQAKVDMEKHRALLQVGYVDTLVGDITARLRETGLYDDAVVVMTSDHGAGFVPGESVRAMATPGPIPESLYADLLSVPLIVKGPGLEAGTVSDANVMSIDIVPTIADMIGLTVPWTVDGISLLGAPRSSDEKLFRKVNVGVGGAMGGGPPPGGPGGPGGAPGGGGGGPGGPGGPGRPGGGGPPPGGGSPPGGPGGGGGPGGMAMSAGPAVTFSAREHLAEVLARHVDLILRADNPEHRWYDVDDAGELVGRKLDQVTAAADAAGTVGLDDLAKLTTPAAGAASVPAKLVGRITSVVVGKPSVAIVVNGTVAAVVPTFPEGTEAHRFEAILDPATISTTANDVRVFVVGGAEGDRSLLPLTIA